MSPNELHDFLRNNRQFDSDDLQLLREGLQDATAAFSNTANVALINSRLAVESIAAMRDLDESIRKLDEGSTKLVTKTNHLTKVILRVTIAAVFFAAVQLAVAILQLHH